MKVKVEYVWLDGCLPEPNLRSKIKVEDSPPLTPVSTKISGLRERTNT